MTNVGYIIRVILFLAVNRVTNAFQIQKYYDWLEQLEAVCKTIEDYKIRKKKILKHIKDEKYPDLTDDEVNALRAVAMSLYERTSSELEKSINLFKDIHKTLVRRR